MKAVLINSDRSLRIGEVPEPVRGPNDVLIDIRAAGVNRADLLQREGNYPPPPGWPDWMGLEVSGVVLDAPAEGRWKVGDKVCALLGGGGYAERVVVPQDMVISIPEGLGFADAAALPEVFATAFLNLRYVAELKAGETLLMQAGASGLGLVVIQMAKLFGAKVMTTVGTLEKADFVRKLGADIVINRNTDKLAVAMAKTPVNVAIDCVGGDFLGECFGLMARGGRWVLIATLGGTATTIPLRAVLSKGLRLIGSTLRSRTNEMKAKILSELEKEIWPAITEGKIHPVIHARFPLSEAAKAQDVLYRKENIGKVILEKDF
ncbi:MAG: NAD(P)H-quinone oxidoreductase [Victivallales bacterium]|nr:NAD(P)H-quinone oxidoreductase [Victivallales bacterium]